MFLCKTFVIGQPAAVKDRITRLRDIIADNTFVAGHGVACDPQQNK
jgi:hypothetical protein